MSSFFQTQPIQIQQNTSTQSSSKSFVNTPVTHKTSSRKMQRRQQNKGQRACVRELSGPQNKNLKKNNQQKEIYYDKIDTIIQIKPQFIPNNESWYNKMNTISSY